MSIRPPIRASGFKAKRHKSKYIVPFIGSQDYTHKLGKTVGDLEVGCPIRIVKSIQIKGIEHVWFEAEGDPDTIHLAMVSKLQKPESIPVNNVGLKYEQELVYQLSGHGIAEPEGAGSTGGYDLKLIKMHQICNSRKRETVIGEVKSHPVDAAFGQLTINFDYDTGWIITDKNRKLRPTYAKRVDEMLDAPHPELTFMTVRQFLNHYHHPDDPLMGGIRAKSFRIEHPDMKPAESYLNDHDTSVVQVGGHGLYKTGKYDVTGCGLPRLKGKGLWLIRQKGENIETRCVQFKARKKSSFVNSHLDLDNPEDVIKIAIMMGHKKMRLRQSIPHIHTTNQKAPSLISTVSRAKFTLKQVFGNGRFQAHVTEKTDGMVFEVGFDDEGFFTRTAHSDKMRLPGDYTVDARRKFGSSWDPFISGQHDGIHDALMKNKNLVEYLKQTNPMRGEVFHRHQGKFDGNTVTLVGTKYYKEILGKEGAFILHTQLTENQDHVNKLTYELDDENFKFLHDDTGVTIDIDVAWQLNQLLEIEDGIKRRNHPDYSKMETISFEFKGKIYNALKDLRPMWGPEAEGYVLHPINGAPKMKIIRDGWRSTLGDNDGQQRENRRVLCNAN